MEAQQGWKKHRVRYLPIFHASTPLADSKREG